MPKKSNIDKMVDRIRECERLRNELDNERQALQVKVADAACPFKRGDIIEREGGYKAVVNGIRYRCPDRNQDASCFNVYGYPVGKSGKILNDSIFLWNGSEPTSWKKIGTMPMDWQSGDYLPK